MDFHTNSFHVIEFKDGVQVIPDNWIQKDKNKCWYPNYRTDKDINKATKKRQTPQDDWLSYPIKQFLNTSETYNDAYDKLKKSEKYSDINTDTDDKTKKNQSQKAY
ncbi:hypothetical protein ALC62_02478 [Cyphomyrmex costatus]|uniref:Uncharacterized protein n=1 Tax=Cyphomyrmex costatus TaxID=456900 RepID=A0A151IN11_9HYME|nr:hypothetical protein ALC62_02478 [Cyphomyrmex costatus]